MKSLVHTPTRSLDDSIAFYRSLDFEIVSATNPTIVRDGSNLIEIATDRFARAGVKIFRENWSSQIPSISRLTEVSEIPDGGGWILGDTTGTWIYLVEGDVGFETTGDGPTTKLGNYAGLSLEAIATRRAGCSQCRCAIATATGKYTSP